MAVNFGVISPGNCSKLHLLLDSQQCPLVANCCVYLLDVWSEPLAADTYNIVNS